MATSSFDNCPHPPPPNPRRLCSGPGRCSAGMPIAFLVLAALGATLLRAHTVAAVAPEEEVTGAA